MITQEELNTVMTDLRDLQLHYIFREGFVFTSVDGPANIFDGIVIRYPADADCFSPKLPFSERSLEEHIRAINEYGIKKAIVIADDIDFLTSCPTLEALEIYPSSTAKNGFDCSPLYKMPRIRSLHVRTEYLHQQVDNCSTTVDYKEINGLEVLRIEGKGHLNYQKLPDLKELHIGTSTVKSLEEFNLPELTYLSMVQCGITTLSGIENCPKLQWLDLSYMRSLSDISSLSALAPTLRALFFENCPKITDFSMILKLKKLEYLKLKGKNELPSLDFLIGLDKLKYMALTMNVLDGNIKPLLNLQYVYAECKRHYNVKSKDLPKDKTDLEFKMFR